MEPKVQIVDVCDYCQGKAYLPFQNAVNTRGETYTQHQACPQCEGSGKSTRWIPIREFLDLLFEVSCHEDMVLDLIDPEADEAITAYQDSRESAGLW